MRWMVLFLALAAGTASGQTVVISGAGAVVVSAQAHADHLAATGGFGHCSRRDGRYEGIGFSTTSPDAAIRACCYWGRRPVREIGTAWSARRRGWIAVVRYD